MFSMSTRAFLHSLELDFNTTKLGSSVDFAKLTGQAAFYKQKFHNIVWANSLRIGLAQPFANSRVPLSEAFFTGGGNSLRGFPLDGAGPQRQVQVCPNGATDCNVLCIQVPAAATNCSSSTPRRAFPYPSRKGWASSRFYDGGNVFPRCRLPRLHFSLFEQRRCRPALRHTGRADSHRSRTQSQSH